MPVAIDQVVGEIEPETRSPVEQEQEEEKKPAELEKLRCETRRLERREARLRAN
jgi:hypothetical protein